ncbi:MAG: hypothetical protein A3J10_00680 [Candidatus Sungbacteria bacterium RIFCSPLOWO2_02_FULL_54_10]|uniref:Uncharacterized protein n=2 Tax=Candidatus Sungiibacteriota TaxID=1817917 RepID=A0A1G2LA99_9BACT|nr:MAG: hypothetical protein A2679_03000 [Candidatus Sungbacteria bacterium RIFCSPHIGHO2_01_FULL_54_26]OHA03102.1 MAG: hypothetical protein A3C92_02065 [Candidatus Sungbacteria bacterium RIFCSPHIGHO2_02_FULL_53_17]OHA07709.1 MAG: hypothetical protein A3B34_00525 [Candidatus Sungbacteria bacterium RIFCSPLOWO2_01_FULL_54_21]OHA12196.1 MAG: hypothetical protein A3J10_00680 [Candidatus Sungbacteria bacterium RIFCSPLOWO2_02_FULL_54_10]
MNGDIENFDEVTTKGGDLYKKFSPVRCPYFGGDVYFNASGLEHLKFKRPRYARSRRDQYMRFKVLFLVPEVLCLSHTVQGVWETKHFERVRIHSRTDIILKHVTYYEFIAVIRRVRIKIVIKQIEDGQRFFLEHYPFWGSQ